MGFGTWMLMGMAALFFDTTGALINLIPGVGQVLEEFNDAFADMVFWLWFKMKGGTYSKTTLFGTFIVKFIPFLDILPEYTLMIILLYFQAKAKKVVAKVPSGTLAVSTLESKAQMARANQERIKNELRQTSTPSQTSRPMKNFNSGERRPIDRKQNQNLQASPGKVLEMTKKDIEEREKTIKEREKQRLAS